MTTPAAHCPRCNSTFYSPDPSNGGAGRNKCLDCGAASPVAEWYAPRPDAAAKLALSSAYGRMNRTFDDYMQQPIIGHGGSRIDPKTMRPARKHELHTDEPAAPIKQYKDD